MSSVARMLTNVIHDGLHRRLRVGKDELPQLDGVKKVPLLVHHKDHVDSLAMPPF
jgi:hypothetical protein